MNKLIFKLWFRDLDNNRLEPKKNEEDKNILLSILIPSLFNREEVFNNLIEKLSNQISKNNLTGMVEIISHIDNKTVRLIRKRNNMLTTSKGKFIAFLDDDDTISDDYIQEIIKSIQKNPETDVITFDQFCDCDGWKFNLKSDINFKSTEKRETTKNNFVRYPWIWCVWRREHVIDILFEDQSDKVNYGEDRIWLEKIIQSGRIKKETKINKILHYYLFDSKKSETH